MLISRVREIVEKALPKKVSFALETPPDPKFGDFACNVAMMLAKKLGQNPREVAEEIIQKLDKNLIAKAEVAGPGFINLFLKDSMIWEETQKPIVKKEVNAESPLIVVDFGGENIAKPMSVGHLRSNIIGQSICNIYKFRGYRVRGINHLGDWGTQFGKLITAFYKWGVDKKGKESARLETEKITFLNEIYIKFHEKTKKNPRIEDEARATFLKLEQDKLRWLMERNKAKRKEIAKQSNELRLHSRFLHISMCEFHEMHKRIGVKFDDYNMMDNVGDATQSEKYFQIPESVFLNDLPSLIQKLAEKKIAIESEGAIIATFVKEGWSPLVIRKSDGATLYSTRDLAALDSRIDFFHPQKMIYCVGSDQDFYFRQLFNVAQRLFNEETPELVHAKFGMVRLPEGKMSTRKGRVIRLGDLLDEAEVKMKAVLDEKNCEIEGEEREKLIRDLAIGSVKFADLGHSRESDITFTWESALSFEGYAAPYLMYTHARACSILRKADTPPTPPSKGGDKAGEAFQQFSAPIEKQLALKLTKFDAAIEGAAASYHPHIIATYIYELAQDFNNFYHKQHVLNAEDKKDKLIRLALVSRTAEVLKIGLGLLGIGAPKQM